MDYAIVECKGLLLDYLYVQEKINSPKRLYMHNGIPHCAKYTAVLYLEVSPLRVLVKADLGGSEVRHQLIRLRPGNYSRVKILHASLFRPPHGKFKQSSQ